VAAQLVRDFGEEQVQQQLAALPCRKAEDRASVLVASVRGRWSLPAVFLREQRRAREAAVKAAQGAAQAVLARKREQDRETLLSRLSGLSEGDYQRLQDRARSALMSEQPAAARLMLGRSVGEVWIRDRMLRLLTAEGG
jgi:hypothetical protein